MSERAKRPSRRHFLLSLGAGGAATAAAVITSNVSQKPSGRPKRASAGYQESAHVRNYYRTAKI